MNTLVTITQACAAIGNPTPRWLNDFLRKTKVDPRGLPLYRVVARAKLIYLERLIEALPCPSKSSPTATKKRKISTSARATLESQLTRAAELTGDQRALLRIWMFFLYLLCGLLGCFICSKSGLQLSVDGHIILFDERRRGAYWRRIGLPAFRSRTSPSA